MARQTNHSALIHRLCVWTSYTLRTGKAQYFAHPQSQEMHFHTHTHLGRTSMQHSHLLPAHNLLRTQHVQVLFNFLYKVLFTIPSWYFFTTVPKQLFSFKWHIPPNLHSTFKEHDSFTSTLHTRQYMTHRSFTFIATAFRMVYIHTHIGISSTKHINAKLHSLKTSCPMFIRHY